MRNTTTVVAFCFILLFLKGMSQTDSTKHEVYLPKESTFDEVPEITYSNSVTCQSNSVKISNAHVVCCDSIMNQNILPHYNHKWQINPRLIENTKTNDSTLFVSFVLKFVCCAGFRVVLDCTRNDSLNFYITNVSNRECFCGGCVYYFTFTLDYFEKKPSSIFINDSFLSFSEKIYLNEKKVVQKNILTGKTTETYYSGKYLMMIKQFNRKGELINTTLFNMNTEFNQ